MYAFMLKLLWKVQFTHKMLKNRVDVAHYYPPDLNTPKAQKTACLWCVMLSYLQHCSVQLFTVAVLCCSLEYHSNMVSDAVKRVIKQGKVSVCVGVCVNCKFGLLCAYRCIQAVNVKTLP